MFDFGCDPDSAHAALIGSHDAARTANLQAFDQGYLWRERQDEIDRWTGHYFRFSVEVNSGGAHISRDANNTTLWFSRERDLHW